MERGTALRKTVIGERIQKNLKRKELKLRPKIRNEKYNDKV